MGSFRAAFYAETEKMYRKKKARVIIILSVITIAFVQLFSSVIRSGLGIISSTASGFPLTVLSIFSNTLLPLFTTLVVIDAFTGEFSRNTMKIALTRPVTRFKVYIAKLAAASVFVSANLLIVMLLAFVAAVLFNAETLTVAGILKIILAYTMTIFPIMTLAVVIAFLANIFKSSAIVFFLTIIIYLVTRVLGFVFTTHSSLFVTTSIDWYKLWIADSLPVGNIFKQLVYMMGYILVFFSAGYYIFDKRDL